VDDRDAHAKNAVAGENLIDRQSIELTHLRRALLDRPDSVGHRAFLCHGREGHAQDGGNSQQATHCAHPNLRSEIFMFGSRHPTLIPRPGQTRKIPFQSSLPEPAPAGLPPVRNHLADHYPKTVAIESGRGARK
jgi:hypothetical protein